MNEKNNNFVAPKWERQSHWLSRYWSIIADGLGAIGTILIGVLMIIICSDVVMRNLFGSSLPLVSELGALTLVMIVFLQLGTTVRHERLARTELFLPPFTAKFPRAGMFVKAMWDLVGAVLCGFIANSTYKILLKDLKFDNYIGVTGVLTIPTWPFRLMILIGITVAAIQFFIHVITGIKAIFALKEEE